MSAKVSLMLALIGVLFLVALPSVVSAQCGDITSSCYTCHAQTHPVLGTTEWHSVFGHRYACWYCHGGNDTAQTKEQAHVGLVQNPLQDPYTSCYACHPGDYLQRAAWLANVMGTPISYPALPFHHGGPVASIAQ